MRCLSMSFSQNRFLPSGQARGQAFCETCSGIGIYTLPVLLDSVHIACMEHDQPRDFACPRCQARYKIVRMRSEPGIAHQMLQCRVCEERLASSENDHILKYFLVSRPGPRSSSFA